MSNMEKTCSNRLDTVDIVGDKRRVRRSWSRPRLYQLCWMQESSFSGDTSTRWRDEEFRS